MAIPWYVHIGREYMEKEIPFSELLEEQKKAKESVEQLQENLIGAKYILLYLNGLIKQWG
tara:strand:+ start:451 stop:630 length:180 start_codon:yes stop_codon:yes gene_type:complete